MHIAVCSKQHKAPMWRTERDSVRIPITSRWINYELPAITSHEHTRREAETLADLRRATHLLILIEDISSRLQGAAFAGGVFCLRDRPISIAAHNSPIELVATILGNWVYLPNVTLQTSLEDAYRKLRQVC